MDTKDISRGQLDQWEAEHHLLLFFKLIFFNFLLSIPPRPKLSSEACLVRSLKVGVERTTGVKVGLTSFLLSLPKPPSICLHYFCFLYHFQIRGTPW